MDKKELVKLVMQWCLPIGITDRKIDEHVENFINEYKEVID